MHALLRHPVFPPLAALLALLAFNLLFTPGFARVEIRDGRIFGSLIDVFQNGAPVMLLAIGMTLVIATAGIDLSVGSVMAVCGVVAALLMEHGHWPVGAAVAAALAAGALLGIWNGGLVAWLGLQPIVATLVLLVAGRGLAQSLSNDQKIRLENATFEWLAGGDIAGIPIPIVLVAVLALAAIVLIRKTDLGMSIEAIGVNPRAAALCGLRVRGVLLLVYAISGLCAALAGLIATADIKEADVANCGLYLELDAILAVVLGGTALQGGKPRILGALIGAVFMQTLTIMLQMRGVVTEHTLILKAGIALLVCALQTPAAAHYFARFARA